MSLVTKDDILRKLGVNLEFDLRKDDDPTGKVQRFIDDIEDWCWTYLRMNFGNNENISDFLDWRLALYKEGVIKQIEYVLRNGKRNIDNGFIQATGLIVDFQRVTLAPDAYNKFYLAGLCNVRGDC